MRANVYQKTLIAYFLLLVIGWIALFYKGTTEGFGNYFYSFAFSLVPLIGGFGGLFLSRGWGGLESAVGRAVFCISLGLFTWGAGSMVWSYYNFFVGVAAPYPGLADIGFVASLPLWIYGILSLSRATGARVGAKHTLGKWLLILLPVFVAVVSYYLLVVVARGGVLTDSFDNYLKLTLDLAYPLGDVVIFSLISVIFSLSIKYLGGQYKSAVLYILIGFAFMYFADFVFSYTTTVGTFYDGDWGDMLFTLALSTITFGTLGFKINELPTGSQ